MNIVYGEMEIVNFWSYEHEIFDWSANNGMTLVTGVNEDIDDVKNGSGKSTLFNALYYALFGSLPFDIKNDNIRNRYVDDKNTYVSLKFTVDGKGYRVTHGLSGKGGYCTLEELCDDGQYKNTTLSTKSKLDEHIIKNIIHTTPEEFVCNTLLNTDPTHNFFLLKPAERTEFLEKMFNIDHFSRMQDDINVFTKRFADEIKCTNARIDSLMKIGDEYSAKNQTFEEEKTAAIKVKSNLYDKARESYTNAKSEFDKLDGTRVKKYDAVLTKIDKERQKIGTSVTKLEREINGIKATILANNSIIKDNNKVISRCNNNTSLLCDSCREKMNAKFKVSEFVETVETKTNENKRLSNDVIKLEEQLKREKQTYDEYQKAYKDKTKERNKINAECDFKLSELRKCERMMIQQETELNSLKNQTNNYIHLIEENNNNISELKTTRDRLIYEYESHKFAGSLVSKTEMEKLAMETMVNALNYEIKSIMDNIAADYGVCITSDLNYHFPTDSTGASPQFKNFSSGEQARLSIAMSLALKTFMSNRSGISSNVVLIDEYIDNNVDSIAIKKILEILRSHASIFGQNIYVISHRTEVKDESFDNTIEIRKKNHISHISKKV